MRKLFTLLAGSLMLGGAAQAKPQDREAELARAVEGRVAGEAVQCIDLRRIRSSRIIPGTAIVYDAGSVVYVNRPDNGAADLNQWDTMVTRTNTSQLCNIDTVTMIDRASHTFSGSGVPRGIRALSPGPDRRRRLGGPQPARPARHSAGREAAAAPFNKAARRSPSGFS